MDYPYFPSGSSANVSRHWQRSRGVDSAQAAPLNNNSDKAKGGPSGHCVCAHILSECVRLRNETAIVCMNENEKDLHRASSYIVALFFRDFFPGFFTARWQQKFFVKRIRCSPF